MQSLGSFQIISHTADVRLLVSAPDFRSLLQAALNGMNQILSDNVQRVDVQKREQVHVKTASSDLTTALIDFLSDVLTLTHENRALYTDITNARISNFVIEATLTGYPVERFSKDIKAVTYHEAEVVQNEQGLLESTIVFDI